MRGKGAWWEDRYSYEKEDMGREELERRFGTCEECNRARWLVEGDLCADCLTSLDEEE